jgi:uncharacterized membrane protein YkoI
MKKMMVIITAAATTIFLTAIIAAGGVYAQQPRQGAAMATHALTGQQYAGDAKIDINAARGIAQKVFFGTILSEELEREGGGSGLRYSFDIRKDGVTHEVGVDAVTGKVLENSVEGH